jgi:hypothetical protein
VKSIRLNVRLTGASRESDKKQEDGMRTPSFNPSDFDHTLCIHTSDFDHTLRVVVVPIPKVASLYFQTNDYNLSPK